MSLNKAIQHGKELRRSYRERGLESQEYFWHCRPGAKNSCWPCSYCQQARLLPRRKMAQAIQLSYEEEKELEIDRKFFVTD